MADIICRWRNGTPQNVVELVNSLPHVKMKVSEFRTSMSTKWKGAFFTSAYQLACQLGLYCEAEDGFYYPRFDHDINEKEAQEYLNHWIVRYYVPNPYTANDGFNNITCPTYVLLSLYTYIKDNEGTDYATAYKAIFKENAKNNDDIMRNYINRFSDVLTMDNNGKLVITDFNPQIKFGLMNRHDKKEFFDNFNVVSNSKWNYYIEASLEEKQKLFWKYLIEVKKLKEGSVKQYVACHLANEDVLNIIKRDSKKGNLYEVTDILLLKKIKGDVNILDVNKKRNNVFTASIFNYIDFIDYLEKNDYESQQPVSPETIENEIVAESAEKSSSTPFSIREMISLIDETGLLYEPVLVKRFAFSLLSKQFLILSGLAGSGKTQLALAFANALVEDDRQMCVVSVGADWTNREPLLGFTNALQDNKYVKPESGVLDLLIEANKLENVSKPYFLVLDEMNMSYVERYFADFLSAMESHKAIPLWKGDAEEEAPQSVMLPKNLFIIGTINVDETTYMFSPKVLDRANVIEFKISQEEMKKFLAEMKPIDRDSINFKAAGMGTSFVDLAQQKDFPGDKTSINTTLNIFFDNLKSVNAEFGYRSATEIYRFINQAQKNDDTTEQLSINEILDCAIVQKLLPKLHGSRKKLEPVLQALWKECFESEEQKATITVSRENIDKGKYPLTADKIQRMYEAAYNNGFTSFAEA